MANKKMKRIIYFIFKSKAFNRSKNIEAIKAEKINRIKETLKYINEWDDIPVSYMFTAICDRLKIQPNSVAKSLVYELMMPNVDINKIKKRLP